jgi:hypothetical protein
MERRVSAYRSALFVLSTPHIPSMLFSSARQRIPIHALFLSTARMPLPALFCPRVRAGQFPFLCLRRRAGACRSNILCLRRRVSACRYRTSLSSGIHSRTHQPRWTWAEAQSVLVLAGTYDKIRCCCEPRRLPGFSLSRTGSALLPRSSPRQPPLAAEVLLPLLPPA